MNSVTSSTLREQGISRFRHILLVSCIGLIGADRIDLFGGHGPFILTPFLFFAPLAILAVALPSWLRGNSRLPNGPAIRRQFPYLALLGIFLLLTLSSIPFGLDPIRGLVTFANLVLVSVLAYLVSVQILASPERERLIKQSLRLALIVYFIFCVGQCVAWTHGLIIDGKDSLTWLERWFGTLTLGPWVPRLTGPAGDPNRAGFVLTMYLVLLDWFVPKSRATSLMKWAIAVFLLLTFSRSAILCWIVYQLASGGAWKSLLSRKGILSMTALCVLGVVFYSTEKTEISGLIEVWNISEIISDRTSIGTDGSSAQDHILLIERGFDLWRTSPKTILTGIGYGSGYKVLTDILDSNSKYDNFHSLFISILVEQGLPTLLVLIVLLLFPCFYRGRSAPAILAIVVFNISYQTIVEPMFWMALATVWSFAPSTHSWLGKIQRASPAPNRLLANPTGSSTGSAGKAAAV